MRRAWSRWTVVALLVSLSPLVFAANQAQSSAIVTTRSFTHPRLGLTVIGSEIDLPAGEWDVVSIEPAGALDQAFVVSLTPPDDLPGRRTMTAHIAKMTDTGRWRLQSLYVPLSDYASTHAGIGPTTFRDLDPKRYGPGIEAALQSPWGDGANRAAPYLFLAPGTRISQAPGTRGAPPAAPLVVELQPYLDDGKHWVLFSDGTTSRVAIDRSWLARHKITVRPVRLGDAAPGPAGASLIARHSLLARRAVGAAAMSNIALTLADGWSGQRRVIHWSPGGGRTDSTVLSDWAMARAARWAPLTMRGHAPILQAWIDRSSALYGPSPASGRDQFAMLADPSQMREPPRTTSVFDLLGGRAALRETLQLELIRAREASPFSAAAAAIPISSIRGVDVTSLPFDRMLAGRPGARVTLADHVPSDRLFMYFTKPAALFPFLSQGGDFLGRTGSTITATAFDDDLKTRYLRRLGLPEESSRRFLESGAITELAVVTPDLFFLEGTDLTVLMRLRAPDAVAASLALLAGIDVPPNGITERRTASGRSAHWARLGDLLCLSTSRRELERVLRQSKDPTTSLGQSAELRYMLTELPVQPATRALVYLSDPFIRRMVGPAVKIGQLRRMRAVADMTLIAAGALLRRLDGQQSTPDVGSLIELGYVPRGIQAAEYRLQPDLTVVSRTWGTLADLASVDADAIAVVTPDEAEAYTTYVQEYREYWRQYFDPIALRLDDAADGALEMTTFILPLIDSQLYNQLRGVLQTREQATPLRVPHVTPAPVFQLSLNLSDPSWVNVASGWSELFSRYTGISAQLFDLVGPGLHIAVQDADPVISLGTADLLGAFGGATLGRGGDLMMPFALSVLTRPCKIFVELQDAPRALTLLRQAASTALNSRAGAMREMPVVFRQVEGRDAWIYTLGVPGMATVRLGLEIQNGYLVLSNIPWSQPASVERVEMRAFNGAAIQVMPDAVRQGLAALFATQAEHDQLAALSSMASLLPLLETGSATPAEASARHAALFGSLPLHPGDGSWVWRDGRLESTRYGSATRWKVPAFTPASGFGLFDGATLLDLNMQFESGGLRAVARWRWNEPAAAKR